MVTLQRNHSTRIYWQKTRGIPYISGENEPDFYFLFIFWQKIQTKRFLQLGQMPPRTINVYSAAENIQLWPPHRASRRRRGKRRTRHSFAQFRHVAARPPRHFQPATQHKAEEGIAELINVKEVIAESTV